LGAYLLGASGLVRAYGKAAISALDNTTTVIRKLCCEACVRVDYALYGKIRNFLETNNYPVKDTRFTDSVEVVLVIEEGRKDSFCNGLTEITGGKTEVVFGNKIHAYFDEEGNFVK